MNDWQWLIPLLISSACIVAFIVLWFFSFTKFPLQTTLRVSLGIISLLAASAIAPKLEGKINIRLDLGSSLTAQGREIIISNGNPTTFQFVTGSVTLLAAICLICIRKK